MRPTEQCAARIERLAFDRPVPITRGTLHLGTGGAFVETVKLPLIVGCTSHLNVYLPGGRVRRQTGCSISPTEVFSSTPGPVRWKLCVAERSCTWIVYVPGGRFVTGLPSA